MSEDRDLEVYKQRYETFRHLDRVRYSLISIIVLVGTLFAAFHRDDSSDFNAIVGFVAGVALLCLGYSMQNVSKGIVANSEILQEFGKKIGDTQIPKAKIGFVTATFWTTLTSLLIGAALVAYSLYIAFS